MTGERMGALALVVTAAALAGCGTTSGGAWNKTGYQQAIYDWQAPYPTGRKALLGPEWQIDNFKANKDGSYAEKTSGSYVAQSREDEDGDGTISNNEVKEVALYDLKYVNARDNGVIWVQTRPVHERDAQKALDVLLENYADSLVGTGLYEQGTVFGTVTPKARSFTTFVTQKTPMKVGPHDALAAVIELAETERLRGDPAWRSAKIRIVLTTFQYEVEFMGRPPGAAANGPTAVPVQKMKELRTAVMLAGYYNDSGHFEGGLASFDSLVGLLRWPHPHLVPARQVAPPAPPPAVPPPPAAPPQEATPPAAPAATGTTPS